MSRSKVLQPQAIYMMTCGCFVFSVSVVPLGSLHVPMGRSPSCAALDYVIWGILPLDAEHPAAAEGDAGEQSDQQDAAAHGHALQKQQLQGAGPSVKAHVPLQQRHDQDVDKVDAISCLLYTSPSPRDS